LDKKNKWAQMSLPGFRTFVSLFLFLLPAKLMFGHIALQHSSALKLCACDVIEFSMEEGDLQDVCWLKISGRSEDVKSI
jgi:hypothetical protein